MFFDNNAEYIKKERQKTYKRSNVHPRLNTTHIRGGDASTTLSMTDSTDNQHILYQSSYPGIYSVF